jgi:cytochrome c peroxidase
VPEPPGLDRFVRDRTALIVLGKALFWDMQLGSDGRTACASCHFHAGADHRHQNQLSDPKSPFVANHAQTADDFPFRLFADAANNRSAVIRDSSQRAGSSGVFRRLFGALAADSSGEVGADLSDLPAFRIEALNVRQVTVRNTPTVINSVFNVRNFWDGRASDIFTGATPFGDSDPRANAMTVRDGALVPEKVRLTQSSLASQAVGPPLNGVEMSYDGRTWLQLARKMLGARPLSGQRVATDDSVLGGLADPDGNGLRAGQTYLDLVLAAFHPMWTDNTLAELNFSLFFGLAIQAYEATLVSDQSRFDRFSEGDRGALSAQEQAGLQVFQGRGECTDCHLGPEFTFASYTALARRGATQRLRQNLLTDTGFVHTGVRPSQEDSGLLDKDDFGVPFSLVARENGDSPLGIAAAFKTPGLRNIEFTGPYFHNGGQATLEQVVEFYNRGGDFPDAPNLSPDVRRLNLNSGDRGALVEFLKSLTDDRVRFERAPFDHPELCVPIGYADAKTADPSWPASALDRWAAIPAVGQKGNSVPLQTFVELLQNVGADGSRAHTLTEPCRMP